MRLGKLEIYPVTDGRFRLDGGAMFGVVPKVLWEKCCPADEKNRIQLGLNCLLIRAQGKNILVDTGLGSKVDPKFQDRFAVERRPPLDDSLKKAGLAVEDVHMVINTHLHFDHCGGNTHRENGQAVSHLPLPYVMGYDLYPLQTLEAKRGILDRAFEEKWLLVFEHDPKVQMGYVKKDIEGKYYLEEVR